MSQPIPRRVLTTGVAWAVPAVAVGAAAPAFAASGGPRVAPTATAVQGPTPQSVQLTMQIAPLNGQEYCITILTVTPTTANTTTWTLPDTQCFTTSPVTQVVIKSNAGKPGITWVATYQITQNGTVVSSGSFQFVY